MASRLAEPQELDEIAMDGRASAPLRCCRTVLSPVMPRMRCVEPPPAGTPVGSCVPRADLRRGWCWWAVLSAILLSLVVGSLPALRKFGLGFLASTEWNPVTEQFGALVPPSTARW